MCTLNKDSARLEILRAFQSTKNFENFETGNGIFLGKFTKNPEIVEFLKGEPFKRNFPGIPGGKTCTNGMEVPGLPVLFVKGNFRKLKPEVFV